MAERKERNTTGRPSRDRTAAERADWLGVAHWVTATTPSSRGQPTRTADRLAVSTWTVPVALLSSS